MDPRVLHNSSAHDRIASIYDAKHTEIYNDVEQTRLGNLLDQLVAMVETVPASVCDFGAGTGNLTLNFLVRGCEVTAIDVSQRSLDILVCKGQRAGALSVGLIEDGRIPCPDACFDIVATYSVLHHVPDYLSAVREMARVLRPNGLLYIDHEASEGAWNANPHLVEYRRLTRLTLTAHLRQLMRTGELFTYEFAKTAFMKAFVNRRYEREGDLHVWPDDHIEWDRIHSVLERARVDVIRVHEYLLFQPRGGPQLYDQYRNLCSDTKYLIGQKRSSDDPVVVAR